MVSLATAPRAGRAELGAPASRAAAPRATEQTRSAGFADRQRPERHSNSLRTGLARRAPATHETGSAAGIAGEGVRGTVDLEQHVTEHWHRGD